MKSFVKVLGVVLVLALLVPVTGSARGQEKPEGTAVKDAKALAGAAKVTLSAALDEALKAAPGIALAGELEQEDNQLIFTFDILPKLTSDEIAEIHVDAKTGAVIKSGKEGEEGEEDEEGEAAEGTEEASVGTALAAELENEDGYLIFSFDILPSLSATELKEVHVDAKTGLVLKTEIEK
jgi:uncharacterized membrane protein YkoI